MASDVPLRSARLPTPSEVTALLEGEFARGGYEIEDVAVEATSRPPRIVVVVDGDRGLDLDTLAVLSRSASELLDEVESTSGDGAAYLLEVTSRGVDRPLTAHRHYRRAQGRKVELTTADGSRLTGRLGALHGDAVDLVFDDGGGKFDVRRIDLSDVAQAVVQVEFSPPNRREIELAGQPGEEANG